MDANNNDTKARFANCVAATRQTMTRSAAGLLCAQSVYGSRGYNIKTTRKNQSQTRRRSSNQRKSRRATKSNNRSR
jgi:hypothetical protein